MTDRNLHLKALMRERELQTAFNEENNLRPRDPLKEQHLPIRAWGLPGLCLGADFRGDELPIPSGEEEDL